MKPPWQNSSNAVPWLVLVTLCLAIAVLAKYRILTKETIEVNKDFIAAVSNIITACFLIIAGILSYFKFFKGRMLSPKLIISLSSGAVRKGDEYFHWIEAQIENKGSVAIWNYETSIQAIFDGDVKSRVDISSFVTSLTRSNNREQLVDVGETVFHHAFLLVPKNVFSVTFQVEVKDQTNTIWERALTVENPVNPVIGIESNSIPL